MSTFTSAPSMTEPQYASVIVDQGLDKVLDYQIPSDLLGSLQPGMRVLVPVRKTLRKATIYALKTHTTIPKISLIHEILKDEPFFPSDLFPLAEWMCHYYCCSFTDLIPLFLPSYIRGKVKQKEQYWVESLVSKHLLKETCETLRLKAPKQAKVLDYFLKTEKGFFLSELLKHEDVTDTQINSLIKQQLIQKRKIQVDRSFLESQEFIQASPKLLNSDQQNALDHLKESLKAKHYATHLLYGVTGSGKTEIFLQAIQAARSKNLGVIVLVPEVSLTTQTIERLKSRFPEKIAVLHHKLSDGERFDQWHKIAKGEINIVLGARSAVFAPVQNLGLLIVDEEHDCSYKQQESAPCYHARDVSIMRGYFSKATVLLASATPSFESFYNAKRGKYKLLTLRKRATEISLPQVAIVNMKTEYERSKGFSLFSSKLLSAIEKKVALGEQVLLFLNKRGYYRSLVCKNCLGVSQCPYCDVALIYHGEDQKLLCHYCGYCLSKNQAECLTCHAKEHLSFKGFGTEQVEHMLKKILPSVRVMRMDADTTRTKGSHEVLFKQFRSGKADVLIGTQMIAKGFDIHNVTLVGVLQADQGLSTPDFRASEYVFQLLTQVAGRSGRGSIKGEVILQTFTPDHPALFHASTEDFEGFYEQEINFRKMFQYPPFTHFSKISFTSQDSALAYSTAETLHLLLSKELSDDFTLFPILKHAVHKVKNTYRYHFLIKGSSILNISKALRKILNLRSFSSKVNLLIDMDPVQTNN